MADDIDAKLTKHDLQTLWDTLLPIAPKFLAFGLQLGVKEWEINIIKENHGGCQNRLYEILVVRLNQVEPLTWRDIVTALKSRLVQGGGVALEIEQRFPNEQPASKNSTTLLTSESTSNSFISINSDSTSTTQTSSFPLTHVSNVHSASHGIPHMTHPQLPQLHTSPSNLPQTYPYPHHQRQQPQWQYQFHNYRQSIPSPCSYPQLTIPSNQGAYQNTLPYPPHYLQPSFYPPQLPIGTQEPHFPLPIYCGPPQQLSRSIHTELYPGAMPEKPHPLSSKHLVNQYIEYVKTVYRNSEVERDTRTVKWPPTPSKTYINLVCIDCSEYHRNEEYDEVTKAMLQSGDVDVVQAKKRPIDFKEVTSGIPDACTRRVVLVQGAPGAGKSTFAWEYCRRWMRGEIAQQYIIVFLIRLRDERMARARTLIDLISYDLEEIRQAVCDTLMCSYGSRILIILEGFDELPDACRTPQSIFLRLICGELLPLATVMVTSRAWATEIILSSYSDRVFQRIEILGFTAQQISEYVESVLPNKQQSEDLQLYVKRHPQIRGCMYIPLNSAMVVTVYQESQAIGCPMPRTLSELYTALARILLVRYLHAQPAGVEKDGNIRVFDGLGVPHDVARNFAGLCKIAYNGIVNQEKEVQLIFKDSDLPVSFNNLGFMDTVTELYVTRGTVSSHNFLHLTFQEFFAAVYISTLSPAQQLKHFLKRREGRLKVVLKFLAGITKLNCLSLKNIEHNLLSEFQPVNYNLTLKCDFEIDANVINWPFEAQADNVIEILNIKQGQLKLTTLDSKHLTVGFDNQRNRNMLPVDYYSLGYCIAHSKCRWMLHLNRDITEEKIDMLVAGANVKTKTHGIVVGLSLHYDISPRILFNGLGNILQLKEMYLTTEKFNEITWPNMSLLQKLHLVLHNERRLSTLLPLLQLESLEITLNSKLSPDDCAAIASYLTDSTTLKEFFLNAKFSQWEYYEFDVHMEPITKALSSNPWSLKSLRLNVVQLTDTAVDYLAKFITKSPTLQRLQFGGIINKYKYQVLNQAIDSCTYLQEKKVYFYAKDN